MVPYPVSGSVKLQIKFWSLYSQYAILHTKNVSASSKCFIKYVLKHVKISKNFFYVKVHVF